MAPATRERLARRREKAARLQDLADTLEESAGDHDPVTAGMLRHMAERLTARTYALVPEDLALADNTPYDQLHL